MLFDSLKVRRPTRSFGWIDHRIITGGHLAPMSQVEVPVYLFLCAVADRHGISFYNPITLARLVKHSATAVRKALESLAERQLIAVQDRFVQVVHLDDLEGLAPTAPDRCCVEREPESEEIQEPASRVLERLSPEHREAVFREARERLRSVTGRTEPVQSVLEALALSVLKEGESP